MSIINAWLPKITRRNAFVGSAGDNNGRCTGPSKVSKVMNIFNFCALMRKNVCSNRKLSKFPLAQYILSITEDYGIRKMLRGKTYMCGARHYLYQYSIRLSLVLKAKKEFAICEKSIANISDLFRPYFLSLPLFPN